MRPASIYSNACSATLPPVHASPSLEFPMNRLLLVMVVCALGLSITACHSQYGTPRTFVISGTVKGLTASGLTLQDNGGDDLTVAANSNSFEFSSPVAYGGAYDVAVSAQPSGLTCTVSHAAGTDVTATVNDVAIACNGTTYEIGGAISGLTTAGLTLEDNGGDALAVPANATSFQFKDPVSAGGAYAVTITTQPPGLVCSVGYGAGSDLQANVSTVKVTCASTAFTIGGAISGLTSNGLVLQNNAGDNLLVSAASSSFQFSTPVAYGGAYNVTVLTQPAALTCTVTNGSSSNVTQRPIYNPASDRVSSAKWIVCPWVKPGWSVAQAATAAPGTVGATEA